MAVTTLATFAKFDFPGGAVRLSDGGAMRYDGDIYAVRDPVWGAVAEMDPVESGIGDMAPAGSLVLAPKPATALSVLMDPALSGCRVQAWAGELDPATGEVAAADRIADWVVDFVRNRLGRGTRTIALALITRAEKLFLTNRGNVISSRFHQSIWAGEKGCDNCTDVEFTVPWGTQPAPSGKAGGSTTPGGGGGGRTWLDALR